MYEQSTKSKTLRRRGVVFIESVLVLLAIIVALGYLNEAPAPDAPDKTGAELAEPQATLAEQAREPVEATIDVDTIKALAWQEVARGNYQAAIAQYNLVLSVHPQDTHALIERGIAYARSGDHESAIDDYSTAAKLNRSDAVVYYNRGISYDALGMTELALADYDHAIRHDSSHSHTWNNRGFVYAQLGEWQNAISDYSQAIELDPTYATAYNNRAIAYVHIHDYGKAQADYEQALELDPDYVDASYNYGILMYKQGDYQAAMNAFHLVIKSNGEKTPQMWNNHGSALHRLGQYQNAIISYTEALKLDPHYELARRNRAAAFSDLGQYQTAVDDYNILLDTNIFDYNLYLARGNAYEHIAAGSSDAGKDYLFWMRRNSIVPQSMKEIDGQILRTELNIQRNFFHQFRVYVEEGDALSFSTMSIGAIDVDPMMVLMQDGVVIAGNDDTDLTLNSALFNIEFEQSGWVSVYVGLAGAGADKGTVSFNVQPAN